MSREIVLGIDFGTSYTSAGALVDQRIELVVDSGDPVIPSVVHVPERGALIVGRAAVGLLAAKPSTTIASVKRLMGRELADPDALRRIASTLPYRIAGGPTGILLQLGQQDWATEQVAAALLDRVRVLAEQRFGATVRRAVVTASAVASRGYQAALRKAAELAHLEVVEIVAEPIAGALALGWHAHDASRRLLVCDFGGGTFDVTAIVQRGARFRVLATGGDPFLGGDDLDQAMVQEVAGLVYKRSRFDLLRDVVRRQTLALRCESVKRALSSARGARLTMREGFVEDGQSCDIDVVIERSWAESLWQPLFDRALAAVDETLERARWTQADVDEVALIGGTSLVPHFQARVRNRFSRVKVTATELAAVAVAMGATLLSGRHGTSGAVPVLELETAPISASTPFSGSMAVP